MAAPTLKAIAALLGGIVAIAIAPILIKFSENAISPNATVFNRLWTAAVILGLWSGIQAVSQRLSNTQPVEKNLYSNRTVGLLMIAGISGSFFQVLWAWSLTQTSVANSALMHSLTPLFTTLVGWIFFNRRFDKKFLIGMVIAIGGASALGLLDLQIDINKVQGDAIALLSAIVFGIYLLALEEIQKSLTSITTILWCCAIGSLSLLPLLLITEGTLELDDIFPNSISGWLIAIALGLTIAVGHSLLTYSLKLLSSGFVSVSILLDPIFTAILAWVFLSEALSFSNLLAFVVILLGIFLTLSSPSAVNET
ncbi:MAG: DMT family transporter [Microcoleus sp.]